MTRYVRAFSGVGQTARTPISRPVLVRARHVGLVLAGVMLVMSFVHWVGISAVGDSHLRSLYYAARGSHAVSDSVVFVAMDEHTGEAWGPPPWSWQRYEDMLAAILAAKPRVVAVLEPGPRVLPSAEPSFDPPLARALADGRLILPPTAPGLGQPRLELQGTHGVEAVSLAHAPGSNVPSTTEQAIRAAGLPLPAGDQLWVHYLGGPSSLPTIPAHRIATGEIPANTFDDRIVIVGLRGEHFAPQVPTPVGPLSPAEVHAHAVRALALDAHWAPMPAWAQWLLSGSLALICLLLLPLLSLRPSILFLLGLTLALLLIDYTLFALGILRVGAAGPLLAVGLAAATSWLSERHTVLRELETISRWSARRLALGTTGGPEREAFNELWERFARTSRTFTQYESTLLGELSEAGWHLEFHLAFGVAADRIHELRRDVRREPYKSAYMMHRPVWSERFMHGELDQKSLLVPLSSFNRVLGLWVINFRKGVEVPNSTMRMIDLLAEQLALTMERGRIRQLRDVRDSVRESLLLRPIQETRTSMQFFAHEQTNLARMFESLPIGVLVATLWGEIEYINSAMRRFLSSLHVDSAKQNSLPDLISALTSASETEVHETVMRLFSGSPFVELSCHSDGDMDSSYQVTLSSLSDAPLLAGAEGGAPAAERGGEDGGDLSALSHLVLTVTRRASTSSQTLRKSAMSGA
jgi:CHASE2 domain-containing sensor protein